MTVNVNDTVERYTIDGAGPYAYSFLIFDASHLTVTVLDSGVPTTLTLDTHYTVAELDDESPGQSLTLLEGAYTLYDGMTLDIRSNTPLEQPTSLSNRGTLSSSQVEAALNRLAREIQDVNRIARAAIRATDTENLPAMVLPRAGLRAGNFLSFDNDGLPAVTTEITGSSLTQGTIIDRLNDDAEESAQDLGALLHPITPAEIDAGVTPTNYAYPALNGNRYGFVGDNSTLNDDAMADVIDVITQMGGAELVLDDGIFLFSEGFEPPESMAIRGSGKLSTTLKANGNFTLVHLSSAASSRVHLRDLTLQGTSKTGTGIQIGDTNHSGQHQFTRIRVTGFNEGVRFAAALWCTFQDCLIDFNEYGVNYNAGSGSMYSNAIAFIGCVIASNDRNGIAATYTPVRNVGLQYLGGSIESNCTEDPTTYAQVQLGALSSFYFNCYGVESAAVTKPDGFNLTSASNGEIANVVFHGSGTGVKASSGTCSNVFIHNCDFNSTTTKCIDLPSCQDILALHNEYDTTNTIDGAGSSDITGEVTQVTKASFTATLTGCTTSPTGTVEYSIIGDTVTLYIPSISGTSNTTAATITGFPAAIRPVSERHAHVTSVDNGSGVISRASLSTGGVLTLYNGVSTTFTASGTKGIEPTSLSYKI